MKVFVIGSGGRENALVWRMAHSKKVSKIFCAPGNPGTAKLAQNILIDVEDLNSLVNFTKKEKIDLTIVGPELPLILGIVDLFEKHQLAIIGPNKAASRIEGSKIFAKELMAKYHILTAKFAVFIDYKEASTYLHQQKYPIVVKADGLCAGKGVKVCQNQVEAQTFLRSLMLEKAFAFAGEKVVIEECLSGQEVSFMVATDGKDFISLLPSQDHKPVFDQDRGPNTGGIGAYAPVPFVGKKMIKRIEEEIVKPTIKAMAKMGCPYKGILYPGLILTREGPKVLEYNCRFGDPETQPVLSLLKTDIMELFEAIQKNKIKRLKLRWQKGSAVCVVLASEGYPGRYEKGKEIFGLEKSYHDVEIFHAGTKNAGKKIITNSGRVLGVTGRGLTLRQAIKKAYTAIGKKGVHFANMHCRKDIGRKGLKK